MHADIIRVETRGQRRQFIDLPHDLFAGDPHYVPALYVSQKKLLDRGKNPFFRHAEADLFLARKDRRTVGRIAAIRNGNYLRHERTNDCFFGFYDCVPDPSVSTRLLDTLVAWASVRGFDRVIGPVNFSTNDSCAVLAEGFDQPPVIQMTYNPPYYLDQLEGFGFCKKMDLLAYRLDRSALNDKAVRLMPVLLKRLAAKDIRIRTIDMRRFRQEAERICEVYNSAWESNWGFVPMTQSEFAFAAAELKAVVDPDFTYIAEHRGRTIGFSLSVPNFNELLIRIRRGRLLPSGIFRLLTGKRKIRSMRILTLGVLRPYRNMGIDACFYAMNMVTAMRKGIHWAEASWILENNESMNRALVHIGGKPYKRYRLYEYRLRGAPETPFAS